MQIGGDCDYWLLGFCPNVRAFAWVALSIFMHFCDNALGALLCARSRAAVASQGVYCTGRHSEAARYTEVVCKFWLSGRCAKLDCPFRHPTVCVAVVASVGRTHVLALVCVCASCVYINVRARVCVAGRAVALRVVVVVACRRHTIRSRRR